MTHIYPIPEAARQRALIKEEDYQLLYRLSIEHPEEFWDQQARHFLDWFRPWDRVFSGALGDGDVRWFDGGQLNVAHNCIDQIGRASCRGTGVTSVDSASLKEDCDRTRRAPK